MGDPFDRYSGRKRNHGIPVDLDWVYGFGKFAG